jgi:hypothetical protein
MLCIRASDAWLSASEANYLVDDALARDRVRTTVAGELCCFLPLLHSGSVAVVWLLSSDPAFVGTPIAAGFILCATFDALLLLAIGWDQTTVHGAQDSRQ